MNNKARVVAVALALAVPVALTSCSNGSTETKAAGKEGSKPAGLAPTVVATPATNAARLPVTTEISARVTNGAVTAVSLTDQSGRAVSGAMRLDDSSWVPSQPLGYAKTYTAKITAVSGTGRVTEKTTQFTTMAKPSTKPIHTSINVFDREKYGVGMPIVVDFGSAIPDKDKAAVERRLFVRSYPSQAGAWHWYSSTEVTFRPRTFWETGTTVSFHAAVGGLPIGGRVIEKDRDATFGIGRDMHYAVTDHNHTMTITKEGQVIKKYPISMGKPSTPSWSGKFVIMNRLPATIFDTLDQPNGYRVAVKYAERLTWSGMFFHSAPWSVGAQGHVNVSHGCVNLPPSAAKWIYQNSLVGDPVSISGTPTHTPQGNGWTVWDVSWDTYLKGSALDSPIAPQPSRPRPAI